MKSILGFAWVAIAIVGSLWIGAARTDETYGVSQHFWSSVTYAGTEAEHFDSLDAMLEDSDLVVVGRFVDMAPGRVLGSPEENDAAYYVTGTLAVEEVTHVRDADAVVPPVILVEVFTFEPTLVPELVASYPRERAVLFLRNKGVTAARLGYPTAHQLAESQFHRLVNSHGLLRDIDGITMPLMAEYDYIRALEGEGFDVVVQRLREIADQPRPPVDDGT